jgi:hypothetical protein
MWLYRWALKLTFSMSRLGSGPRWKKKRNVDVTTRHRPSLEKEKKCWCNNSTQALTWKRKK